MLFQLHPGEAQVSYQFLGCSAKFVEFAGYEMPIQYDRGIIEEHKFTREFSGIFDVSHMGQLFIYGDESSLVIPKLPCCKAEII